MKTTRRGFLKFAGKAGVAAATAGAAVKAGAAEKRPPPIKPLDVDRVLHPAREISGELHRGTHIPDGDPKVIHTSELALVSFAMHGVADIGLGALADSPPLNPIVRSHDFALDVYYGSNEDVALWAVYAGDPITLIVDHKEAPPNARGEYSVIATDVDLFAAGGEETRVSLILKEVH